MHSGCGQGFIGAHPESEDDGLTRQVQSQIDHCIDVTIGITARGETKAFHGNGLL